MNRNYSAIFTLTLAATLSLSTLSAHAKDRAKDGAKQATTTATSPLSSIYACKAVNGSTERLSCYDSAVTILQGREARKEIVTIDSNAAKTIKREAFGFALPSLPKLGLPSIGSHAEKGADVLEFPVRSVSKTRHGVVLTMKNGQVWRGVNGRLNYIPKGELTARISRGAVGSYRLSLSNGKERVRGLGVRRVE